MHPCALPSVCHNHLVGTLNHSTPYWPALFAKRSVLHVCDPRREIGQLRFQLRRFWHQANHLTQPFKHRCWPIALEPCPHVHERLGIEQRPLWPKVLANSTQLRTRVREVQDTYRFGVVDSYAGLAPRRTINNRPTPPRCSYPASMQFNQGQVRKRCAVAAPRAIRHIGRLHTLS